ncbi:MAG: endonuclease/exonuclease/phosphatase family protein [Paracoccaceae bacterium]
MIGIATIICALCLCAPMTLTASPFPAKPLGALRVATWHAPLSRKGPGLLLRDLLKGAKDLAPVLDILRTSQADVIVLTRFDYDADGATARVLADALSPNTTTSDATPPDHAPAWHIFAPRPNTGMPTGRDMDGNGARHEARDAQGFGLFAGQSGVMILSRLPFEPTLAQTFTTLLWQNAPNTRMAADDPGRGVQRLSSTSHVAIPLRTTPPLWIASMAATPPVFDGPEDRNGRRNADEVALWRHWLDGALPYPAPQTGAFVIAGNANLDPTQGEGLGGVMRDLLAHPRIQDPAPQGRYGPATADWDTPRPGKLRVSYVLPSTALPVLASGVHWADDGLTHRMVWVDIAWPPAPS